jgi:DNA replication regulator SLD2
MRQPPFKKRGIVRSLSSIIQGMRKQEDDKLDEELEMMREMEDADDGNVPTKPTVQVEDSRVVMPLGPDKGIESEESEEDERDTGIFRKPWKKKGLKRQTKRTNSKSCLEQRHSLNHTNYS